MGYKIGDTPKFIGTNIHNLFISFGKRYKILDFDNTYSNLVYIINDSGKRDFWNINRFESYKQYIFDKEMKEIIADG